VPAQIAQTEAVAEQSPRRRRHDYPAGFREPLQPRRQIGRVADHCLLLRRSFADDIADHDEARGDADAHAEPFDRARLQPGNDLREFQPRVHRPRRVVLMRAREAKIRQNPVAHEFGDEAIVARYHARARILIGADDLPHVLGIEPRRHRGGPHEVAEHHGELPPLGGVLGGRG
jgi:hypothetical protein